MEKEDHVWYLLDTGALHPHMNMALDEALLDLPPRSPVVLRLYEWDPPGLSLGYFQQRDSLPARSALRYGAVVTRRMTGGGAILHAGEITYSIAGDAGRFPFGGTVEESYLSIHAALAAGLSRIGVKAGLRGKRGVDQGGEDARGRCFYTVTSFDLVAGVRKIVGSAQRRRGGRVLHHGSIPFDPNPMTPASACLKDIAASALPADRSAALEAVRAAIKEGIRRAFGVRLVPWRPGPEVEREAARLFREKYAAPRWIDRV